MAITSYRSYSPFEGLNRLNRMLDEAFAVWPEGTSTGAAVTSAWFPPTDVCEDKDSLEISMELPGVRAEDVKLSLENNILTVRGEKRQDAEQQSERIHRFERSYGAFERGFALPSTVDPEKIEARHENGILTIRIPKAERAKPRQIPVSSSVPASGSSRPGVTAGAQTTGAKATGPSQPVPNRDPEEEGSAAKRR